MSRAAEAWVDQHSQARGNARVVLRYLAGRLNAGRGYAWPRISTIAADCRIPERTVRYNLRQLVAIGELTIQRTGRSSLYRMPLAVPVSPVATPAASPPATVASSCRSERQKLPISTLLIGNPPRGYPWGEGESVGRSSPSARMADGAPRESCERHQRRRRTCPSCQARPRNPATTAATPGRPSWCGSCDEHTRQDVGPLGFRRCPSCHPLVVGVPA